MKEFPLKEILTQGVSRYGKRCVLQELGRYEWGRSLRGVGVCGCLCILPEVARLGWRSVLLQ